MTKTKRVRIAVAVDPQGSVSAYAIYAPDDDPSGVLLRQGLLDGMEGERVSVVEADIPLPEEPATVRGEVVDA